MAVAISDLPSEVVKVLRSRKWTWFFLFLLVAALVLLVGVVFPKKYISQAVIKVDDPNMINPLMNDKAPAAHQRPDRAAAIFDVLNSRDLLLQLSDLEQIFGEVKTPADEERVVQQLRLNISVEKQGKEYIKIGYTSPEPDHAFVVAQKLTQLLIDVTSSKKREDVRSAYEFIDKQVRAYQSQIEASERRLKEFLASKSVGSEVQVSNKVVDLERQIEETRLAKQEAETQARVLQSKVGSGSDNQQEQGQYARFEDRILSLQQQLDTLRLSYQESYPDIVSLKQQITELERLRDQLRASNPGAVSLAGPGFRDLQSELLATETRIETLATRLNSLGQLLELEQGRMERVQDTRAKVSELTRDYEVNKEIYDDLLQRRERARVALRIDVEGYGVNYVLHESARLPREPAGLAFYHFALAGLPLGLLAPFGIAIAFCMVDPRVRSAGLLHENTGVPVLSHIQYLVTPYEERKNKSKTRTIIILSIFAAVAYIVVAWFIYAGGV